MNCFPASILTSENKTFFASNNICVIKDTFLVINYLACRNRSQLFNK